MTSVLVVLCVQSLAKYSFGMGSLQVLITTLLFTAFALPAGASFGTKFLEFVCHAPPSLVSIRTFDEVSDQQDLGTSQCLVVYTG